MRELLACLRPVLVEAPGGPYSVRPAMLEEALQVLAALEGFASEPRVAWTLLEDACRDWLPAPLFEVYFGEDAFPRATLSDVKKLLEIGVVDPTTHAAKQAKLEGEAEVRSWVAIIADFADTMHMAPTAVLKLSWPLFVSLSHEVHRILATRKADVMIGYMAARAAGAKRGGRLWRDIVRAASYRSRETGRGGAVQAGALDFELDPNWDYFDELREKGLLAGQAFGRPEEGQA